MPTSILLVDNHAILRAGVRILISEDPDIHVVGEAEDGRVAIRKVQELKPDLVVMDIGLPNVDGIEATRQIKEESPETKVLALSIHSERRYVQAMLQAGASGYLLKESAPEELLTGIQKVTNGEIVLSAAIQDVVVSQFLRLLADEPDAEQTLDSENTHDHEVLHTKFYRPRTSTQIVPRERLWMTLDEGLSQPLTLISAPAGYGKSTLVIQWLEARAHPSVWISLDEGDNVLRIFLTYLVTATQTLFPDSLAQSAKLLHAPKLPAATALATTLNNELMRIPQQFILVLDDYHRIDAQDVHELMREILHHPPPNVHFFLTTRIDPFLDLLHLRAYGKMVEVRAQELRFTPAEIADFLDRRMGSPADDAIVTALMDKTEGWVTGLHLIALAAQDHAELTDIARFQPGEQQSLEFLVVEALAHQPRAVEACLLTTSILDRFCAPLCDAICGIVGSERADLRGRDFIDWLKAHNLFVISLDHDGQWFRYHHLFQQLLQKQLELTLQPDEISALHMRASEWFAAQEMIDDAFKHALAAGNLTAAAELVEEHRYVEFEADRWHVVEQWLSMLPNEIKQQRVGLALAQAWIEYIHFRLERMPPLIEQAAAQLDQHEVDRHEGDEHDTYAQYRAETDFLHGYLLLWSGEVEESVQHLEMALTQASATKPIVEINIEIILNMAYSMAGQQERAIKRINARMRDDVDGASLHALTYRLGGLAFIYTLAGDLPHARATGERLETVADRATIASSAAWGAYTQGCSHLHMGEFARAVKHLTVAAQQRYVLDSNAVLDSLSGIALAEQLMGREDAATESLIQLSDFAQEVDDSYCLAIARSARARLDLLRGDLEAAVRWALTTDEIISPATLFLWLEAPATTQARVLIALGSKESLRKATRLLKEIRRQSEACHFTNHTIETMLLQALAAKKMGDERDALASLNAALTLAAPGGWIRPFVEAGQPMTDLLIQLQRKGGEAEFALYTSQILAACPDRTAPSAQSGLVEPLTEREQQVLPLLVTEMSAKEIADHLVVSVSTVRAHIRNIYAKLSVHSRHEAVQKARALGIL